jgi:hypothetical protein
VIVYFNTVTDEDVQRLVRYSNISCLHTEYDGVITYANRSMNYGGAKIFDIRVYSILVFVY